MAVSRVTGDGAFVAEYSLFYRALLQKRPIFLRPTNETLVLGFMGQMSHVTLMKEDDMNG